MDVPYLSYITLIFMISVDHTLGLPQIVLSSEVFQMAEYDYTKHTELIDHDYSCSPY